MMTLALLLAQVALPPPAVPDAPSVLVIEDFDHPRLHRSRLEAEWGSVNEERVKLDYSHEVRYGAAGYALQVRCDLKSDAPAGFWFSAAGRADDDRLWLDLRPFQELRFHTRGTGPGSPRT